MPETLSDFFSSRLPAANPQDAQYVSKLVDAIIMAARDTGVSDVHLLPQEDGLTMCWRVDGVLQQVATFPPALAPNVVARLKVLSELLTYRTDVPQEGRIRSGDSNLEMRVSTFPTLFGEKCVVRLFIGSQRYRHLDDLGLPQEIADQLLRLLAETGGIILITGPAGSGKTTTNYALMRELVDGAEVKRSLVSIEDPIEAVLAGVSQSQIRPSAGFDYEAGLRSLMRQDPEVIMVGEIRDRRTAETVFQASLTGHLVLTTFHAGSAAGAVSRLSEMGIEPYILRSGILAIVCQRLVRRLCDCAVADDAPESRLGLNVERMFRPVGCDTCRGTGYSGRMVLAEMLLPQLDEPGRAILSRRDTSEIESLAIKAGMVTRWDAACRAVNVGETTPSEIRRVFGFR